MPGSVVCPSAVDEAVFAFPHRWFRFPDLPRW